VIDFGRFKLRGTIAWWIWGIAHIYFLSAAQPAQRRDLLAVDPRPRSARRAADHARQQQGRGDLASPSPPRGQTSKARS
jgi:hypothetical protein